MTQSNPSSGRVKRIAPSEAQEIALRFINGHFGNAGKERPRIRIPADPEHDDDIRLLAFIAQAEIPTPASDEGGAKEEQPYFGPCCAKPPVVGKIYNLILDDDDMPPHVHSYRSIQEHLKSALEMLDDGDEITLKITRKDMTQSELDALPEQ